VIPGQMAKETIQTHWGQPGAKFVTLPNLVDAKLFRDGVSRLRNQRDSIRGSLGVSTSDRLLFASARIEERYKGLIGFLEKVRDLWPSDVTLVVAGTGPDLERTNAWLRANLMNKHVVLVGHMKAEQLIWFLAAADTFLLPSLRDANPLSAIEALWAGLPLLISKHCGNCAEVVTNGDNGWVFDPLHVEDVRSAFKDFLAAPPLELAEMGRRSLKTAELRFSTEKSVKSFFDQIQSLL